ncbi:MAG TPA: heavy-metal-associated domain-containing protein [Clostridia bacterium]|jgi:copper chaperone CopZ
MKKSEFILSNLACEHCIARVSKAVKKLKGVKSHNIDLKNLSVEYDENKITDQDIINTVTELGYGAQLKE